MRTVKYIKPSGKEMEVNDMEAVHDYAARNGWERVKPKPKQKPKSNSEPKLDKLI